MAVNAVRQRRRRTTGRKNSNAKLRDWQAKERYLGNTYKQIAPLDFYTDIGLNDFPEEFSICATHVKQPGRKTRHYNDIVDMLMDAEGHSDAYVYPASYYKSYAKTKLMHSVSCVYIDLDHVKAHDLRLLCQENFFGFRPTYLVNSGNGVHLVYALKETQQTYHWAKFLLQRIHSALLMEFTKHAYKADLGTGLSHAYRIVGSRTKLGQVCTVYHTGKAIAIEDLAASVGIEWKRPTDRKRRVCPMLAVPNGGPRFYTETLRLIAEKTVQGHRYNSMFALTCVGYKCGVAVEQIRRDALKLANLLHLAAREAEHAVEACNPKKAITVRAETLEKWFGWRYERKTKRNGRTRKEHLTMVAQQKIQQSVRKVMDYLKVHPKATQTEIAEGMIMDRKTVRKHLEEARQRLAELAMKAEEKVEQMMDEKCPQNSEPKPEEQGEDFIASIPSLTRELCSGSFRDRHSQPEYADIDYLACCSECPNSS